MLLWAMYLVPLLASMQNVGVTASPKKSISYTALKGEESGDAREIPTTAQQGLMGD